MIYLISQTLLCLALAALFGGALGWLAHRVRTRSALSAVRGELARRTRLLTEAQADVQMLGEDFEELRVRSREEIDALRAENAELPALAANLEKSQLMVRQLMQRHDAQLRDLTTPQRGAGRAADDAAGAGGPCASGAHAELEASRLLPPRDESGPEPATSGRVRNGRDRERGERNAGREPRRRGKAGHRAPSPRRAARTMPPSEGGETLDEVMEVGTELAAELRDDDGTEPQALAVDVDAARGERARTGRLSTRTTRRTPRSRSTSCPPTSSSPSISTSATRRCSIRWTTRTTCSVCFGIGPITEKALNTLGITSYSQLAELERHEIEKIADALQIGPERIEKDDWVGNARRQLEDVLETALKVSWPRPLLQGRIGDPRPRTPPSLPLIPSPARPYRLVLATLCLLAAAGAPADGGIAPRDGTPRFEPCTIGDARARAPRPSARISPCRSIRTTPAARRWRSPSPGCRRAAPSPVPSRSR